MHKIFTKLFPLCLFLIFSCTKKEENIPTPIITNINPTSGVVNTEVIITGNHFSPNVSQNIVKFNNTPATVTAATATQLIASVPQGAVTGNISVSVNGKTATSSDIFTVYHSPTITTVNPTNGIIGAAITITGSNFSTTAADNIVQFNGTNTIVTEATATQLTTTVPTNATTGKISVTVHGLTATSTDDFIVIRPPTIASFSPSFGKTGSTIIIIGANFSPIPTDNIVKFNNVTASVISSSTTQVETSVPSGDVSGKISVTVNNNTATSESNFTLSMDQWIRGNDFDGDLRIDAVGFSIGNYGYVGTGNAGGNGKQDFYKIDNGWSINEVDFANGLRSSAVGFSIGDKGYIGLGYGNDNSLRKDLWEFDPVKRQWTQKADFEGIERHNAVGLAINNKGYVGTGADYTNAPLKDFWEYDPASNRWTKKADFGGEARSDALGFSIDGKGYLGTGVTHATVGNSFKDFWEYNPVTDQWIQKADFGGSARHNAISFVIGTKGYVGTGRTLIKLTNTSNTYYENKDFWEYDPIINQWTRKADCSNIERQGAVGFAIGNKGYVLTGNKLGSFNIFEHKYIWEYTP